MLTALTHDRAMALSRRFPDPQRGEVIWPFCDPAAISFLCQAVQLFFLKLRREAAERSKGARSINTESVARGIATSRPFLGCLTT